MMPLIELDTQLEKMESTIAAIDELTNETVAAIRNAFLNKKDVVEDIPHRVLAKHTGMSATMLATWFPKGPIDNRVVDEDKTDVEKKNSDGPKMINVIKAAALAQIALPDVFEFDSQSSETVQDYYEEPNAWNVFIQNLQSLEPVVLSLRSEVVRQYGKKNRKKEAGEAGKGYTQESRNDSDDTKKLVDFAEKLVKNYWRIVQPDAKEKKDSEDSLGLGQLMGNPNCQLKTVISVIHRLNPDMSIRKWFQRWSATKSDHFHDEQIPISLYDDEKTKLSLLAPYIPANGEGAVLAVRAGAVEEMEGTKYSENDRIREPLSIAMRGGHNRISKLGKADVRGKADSNGVCISNWGELYEKMEVHEGDLIFAFRAFTGLGPRIVTLNLTRMSADEILLELSHVKKQEAYQSLWLSSNLEDRYYTLSPDNASLELYYNDDPLWIYHTEDSKNEEEFDSVKFPVDPVVKKWNDEKDRPEQTDFVVDDTQHLRTFLLEAKTRREVQSGEEGLLFYHQRLQAQPNIVNVVRTARFRLTRTKNLFLTCPHRSKAVVLCLWERPENDTNDRSQMYFTKRILATWSKEEIAKALAEKIGSMNLEERNPQYNETFFKEYKERILKHSIDELIQKDRIWLEVLFPMEFKGEFKWYWHVDYRVPPEM